MPNSPLANKKRRWQRHPLNAPVRIISEACVVDGFGLRVSEGGMYLLAVADMEPGSGIEVEFTTHSGKLSRSSAVVRNRSVYLYGVEFLRHHRQESSRQVAPQE